MLRFRFSRTGKRLAAVALVLLTAVPVRAQWLRVTEEGLRESVEALCSPELEGRAAGSRGDTLAARWIRDRLASYRGMRLLYEDGIGPFAEEGRGETVRSFNVAGWLEGNDPVLRDEVIVVGAHYDHMGRQGEGYDAEVLYGADDNASGTALTLELAAELARNRRELRRSVLVVLFGGEEAGLLGSRHFCENPPLPQGKRIAGMFNFDMVGRLTTERGLLLQGKRIAGMFNFDMVGRLTTERGLLLLGADTACGPWAFLREIPPPLSELAPVHYERETRAASDYLSFLRKGIPALCFNTGIHADYHKAADRPEKINYYGMRLIADHASAVLEKLVREGAPLTPDGKAQEKR